MHTPEPRLPGVSVKQAAIHFGVSESDIRRRIKRGGLQAESIARPGGTLLRVLIDAPATDSHSESVATPEPRQDASEAFQVVADALAEERADRQRLNLENAELRERVGRAEAASEAASTRAETLQAEVERLRGRPPWWRWWLG